MCLFVFVCLHQHPGQVELPGGGKVNQFGLFTEAAPGISLSNLISKSSVNAHLLGKIDSMQIQKVRLAKPSGRTWTVVVLSSSATPHLRAPPCSPSLRPPAAWLRGSLRLSERLERLLVLLESLSYTRSSSLLPRSLFSLSRALTLSCPLTQAALYDFLFCCADRHSQNIFIDEHANIKLIDNDLLLGGAQRGRDGKGSCSPRCAPLHGQAGQRCG